MTKLRIISKGGPGSGHRGHRGRPGERGGSIPDNAAAAAVQESPELQLRNRHVNNVMDWIDETLEEREFTDDDDRHGYLDSAIAELQQSPELEEAINAKLDKMLDDCAVCVRVDEHVLSSILEDGRFKNQFETHTSGGALDNGFRASVEEDYFGIHSDYANEDSLAYTEPQHRPIYGYMADTLAADDGRVAHYGNLVVVLKDEVRERTTVTGFDSLDAYNFKVPATRLEDASWKGFVRPYYTELDITPPGSDTRFSYIEAQIHGGVTVDDIKKVYAPAIGNTRIDAHVQTFVKVVKDKYPDLDIEYVESNKHDMRLRSS